MTTTHNSTAQHSTALELACNMPKLRFKKLHPDAVIPKYATDGSAGLDLTAVSWDFGNPPTRDLIESVYGEDAYGSDIIESSVVYRLGIAVEIPKGYVGLLIPRSSVATKTDLSLANSVGVIDSDYRGELMAVFRTHYNKIRNEEDYYEPIYTKYVEGDRVCQLVVVPAPQFVVEEVEALDSTTRGEGGFGSTGK